MQKNFIIAGIVIFVLTTVLVMVFDDNTPRKKVQITNQNLVINNENTEVKSEELNINLNKTKVDNKPIDTKNKDIEFNQNRIEFENTESSFSNQDTQIDEKLADYEKQQTRLRDIENAIKNKNSTHEEKKTNPKYELRSVSWNAWKSNFVNAILDGSLAITSLDDYPTGSWFYFAFDVDKDGSIHNIKVTSMQLSATDRKRVADLIKGFQYTEVTVFPQNSKRVRAKVDAVVMLGNTEKKSKPSDFNDMERIKIQIP